MLASACGSPLRGLDLAGLERGVFLQGILLGADMSGVRPELMTKYLPTNFTDLLGAQQLADIKAEIANWTELVPDKGAKNAPDLFPPPITSTAWDTCSVPLRRSTSRQRSPQPRRAGARYKLRSAPAYKANGREDGRAKQQALTRQAPRFLTA